MTRPAAALHPTDTRALLQQVLDEPELAQTIQSLEPRVLASLVRSVGLEDAGEIVAMATGEQIARVLDEDLWVSEGPGADERLDPERFVLWLGVMLEAGAEHAARRLAEQSEDLIALGLHQHVLVIDLDVWAMSLDGADDDAEQVEKALDSCLYLELDQYRVISRGTEGWDAIVEVLLALDRDYHDLLQRILALCESASASYVEDHGGLFEVLTAEEMLASDVAGERAERRAAQGFVAASDARAFLALTRQTSAEDLRSQTAADPITQAYFRDVSFTPTEPISRRHSARPETWRRILALAAPSDEAGAPSHALGDAGAEAFAAALRSLSTTSRPDSHERRMLELAYLANVLLAAEVRAGQRLRPVEAARIAAAFCSAGLDLLRPAAPGRADEELLGEYGAVQLFRLAYRHDATRRRLLRQ